MRHLERRLEKPGPRRRWPAGSQPAARAHAATQTHRISAVAAVSARRPSLLSQGRCGRGRNHRGERCATGRVRPRLETAALAICAVLVIFAAFDPLGIERRVVEVNKRVRMEVYLRQVPVAPRDFKGRIGESAGAPAARAASFAEQERVLADIERSKSHKH